MARIIPAITTADYHWKAPVDNIADLPTSGNQTGDVRTVINEQASYMWDGTNWIETAPDAELSLDDLTDADTSTIAPSVGDHLEWDGNNWIPGDHDAYVTYDETGLWFYSDTMLNPNADWTVTVIAPLGEDTNNARLLIRLFDDTTAEGAGLPVFVPSAVTTINITTVIRAETAPGAAAVVGMRAYGCTIDDGGVPGAWSAATALDNTPIGTNENWVYVTTSDIVIGNLNLVAGEAGLIELTRNPGVASDLTGDAVLLGVQILWKR